MAKRREPIPLRLVAQVMPQAEPEPVPSLHGHFPHLPFRHPGPVGAGYKPSAESALFRGDQRLKRRVVESVPVMASVPVVVEKVPVVAESGELPTSVAWRERRGAL